MQTAFRRLSSALALLTLAACDPQDLVGERAVSGFKQEFPSEHRVALLSAPRALNDRKVHHTAAGWFEEGPAVFEFGESGCARLGADLQPAERISSPYWCNDVIDFGQPEAQLVTLEGDTLVTSFMVLAWNQEGDKLWSFHRGYTFDTATPLWDEDGLYGLALGPGGDEGIVAIDLRGKQLWDLPRQYVLYRLSAHPDLPGKLLAVGGDTELFDHTREDIDAPSALEHALANRPSLFSYRYDQSGVLFPDGAGAPAAIVSAVLLRHQPVLVRLDKKGKEVWRAKVSGSIEDVVLLGRRRGKHVFAAATRDRQVLVFDEDGALLDSALIDGHDEPYVFAFKGGPTGESRWSLTLDTSQGSFLIDVDLDGR